MRWNKRTAMVGLTILLPVFTYVIYRAVPAGQAVHKQTVAPVATEQTVAVSESPLPSEKTVAKDALQLSANPEPKPLPSALDLAEKRPAPSPNLTVPPASAPPLPDLNVIKASASESSQPPLPPPVSLGSTLPPPVIASPPAKAIEIKCPWSLRLEVVKGRTILTAETGKDASFRIDCERLELKAPQGSIQAMGDVKISGNGLEGTSERLTVNLQDDQVILEGRATLVSRRDGENMEVKGERLSLRLVRTGADAAEKNTAKK
jgi:hypothetical protein